MAGLFPKDNHRPNYSTDHSADHHADHLESSSPPDCMQPRHFRAPLEDRPRSMTGPSPTEDHLLGRDDPSRAFRSDMRRSNDLGGIVPFFGSLFSNDLSGNPSFSSSGEDDWLEDGLNDENDFATHHARFNSGLEDNSTMTLGRQEETSAVWPISLPTASGMQGLQQVPPLLSIEQLRTIRPSLEGHTLDPSRSFQVNFDEVNNRSQPPWSPENPRGDPLQSEVQETVLRYVGSPGDSASASGVGSQDWPSVPTDWNGTTAVTSANPSSMNLSRRDAIVGPGSGSGESISHDRMSLQNDLFLSVPRSPGSASYTTSPSPSNRSSTPDVVECKASQCDAKFSGAYRKGNLARHRRDKHVGSTPKMYPCKINGCGRTFKRPDARLKHFRKKHEDVNPSAPIPRLAR